MHLFVFIATVKHAVQVFIRQNKEDDSLSIHILDTRGPVCPRSGTSLMKPILILAYQSRAAAKVIRTAPRLTVRHGTAAAGNGPEYWGNLKDFWNDHS